MERLRPVLTRRQKRLIHPTPRPTGTVADHHANALVHPLPSIADLRRLQADLRQLAWLQRPGGIMLSARINRYTFPPCSIVVELETE